MKPLQTNLSIYSRLGFERKPVGINYFFHKPAGIEKLDKKMAFCEMSKEAQLRDKPFYFTRDEEDCIGTKFLGMEDPSTSIRDGGMLGVKLELFQQARANLRLRTFVPSLANGSVNYVVFSPIDQLAFEPDLLYFIAPPSQAEILLRAMTYSTGEMYESRTTVVACCSSLLVYPYLTGKVNYTTTGLSYGMNGRKIYPDGLMLITIPYQWIPTITQNLNEMKWVPPAYALDREDFIANDREVTEKTRLESRNP